MDNENFDEAIFDQITNNYGERPAETIEEVFALYTDDPAKQKELVEDYENYQFRSKDLETNPTVLHQTMLPASTLKLMANTDVFRAFRPPEANDLPSDHPAILMYTQLLYSSFAIARNHEGLHVIGELWIALGKELLEGPLAHQIVEQYSAFIEMEHERHTHNDSVDKNPTE